MARAIADLERDIHALSNADKEELLSFLISELGAPSEELAALARELKIAVARTGKAIEAAVSRVEGLDAELAQGRIEVREAVRRSGETWPFGMPSSPEAN